MRFQALLAISFMLAAPLFAAPLIDEPLPTLTLTNGRSLHDAQAKSYASKSVMIRHRDGAETIAYDLFPAALQPSLLAKRPTPPNPEKIEYAKKETAARMAATAEKKKKSDLAKVRYGCRIIDYHLSTNTDAVITLKNETDKPITVFFSDFICRTSDNRTWPGHSWIVHPEGYKSISHGSTTIPGNADWVESVSFFESSTAPAAITAITWK